MWRRAHPSCPRLLPGLLSAASIRLSILASSPHPLRILSAFSPHPLRILSEVLRVLSGSSPSSSPRLLPLRPTIIVLFSLA